MNKFFKLHSTQVLISVLLLGFVLLMTREILKVSANEVNRETYNRNQETAEKIKDSPIFAEFNAWVKQYTNENLTSSNEQIQTGENLAAKRRQLLKELIQLDPKAALEKRLSTSDYNHLPDFITKNLEKPISGYGDFNVYIADEIDHTTGKMTGSRTQREVVIGDFRYKAFVYGRREGITTKINIPLQGIVIDDVMAVDENPVRKIEPEEYAELRVDTSKLNDDGVVAEVGGKITYFFNYSEFSNFVNQQIEWESKIGPVRPKENFSPEEPDSLWTEGAKKVLFIRVDFPDRPGEPVDIQTGLPLTVQRAREEMDKVNTVYTNSSYGKTSFQSVIVTPVIRLSQPSSFYMPSPTVIKFNEMMTDARNAARTAGFETNNFDLDVVASTNNGVLNAAALGLIGEKGTWVIGYFTYGFPLHEIGHNYGLNHNAVWRTTDGTTIGQGYETGGDLFDAMGYNGYGLSATHFMASDKRHLDWLTDANVQSITNDGVYRVFAQDSPNPNNIRLLRIRKDSTRNYDIEFRQSITSNPNTLNGAIIRWHYPQERKAQLLDMTPNTNSLEDAPLLVGQSFFDNVNRIRITVLGKGNTTPESLDIKVELNIGCSFSLGQTTQNFSASGGEGNISVATQNGCRPPATNNNDWLYAFPTDTGLIRYIVAANYDSQPRTGTFNVAGQVFTVQQKAAITDCAQQPSGLISWWRGEGNGLDQTGLNNGIVTNNLTFDGGKVGGGFLGDYTNNRAGAVEIPNSLSLALNRSMTFEGWLKLDSYRGKVIERRTRDLYYLTSYDVQVSFSGSLQFLIYYSSDSATGIGSPPLPLGQFVHFAASLDDETGQMRMYINGSLVEQRTITQRPLNIPEAIVKVGNINGVTDELSVYNRALSASEILAIYNAGTATTGAAGKCLSAQPQRTRFDFDGDGKADISVYRPNGGIWYLLQSQSGFTGAQFGVSTDKLVPADYDGDGKTDLAVYRNGTWYLLRSQLGFTGISFGDSNDIPQPADFDGDGKAELAVWRPSNGTWYVYNLVNNQFTFAQFGASTDKPVVGDYDGDGKANYAVFRPSVGFWYIARSTGTPSQNFDSIQFGDSNDKPVPADYDGDGKTDVAVFRPSNGSWYLLRSQLGFTGVQFGISSDLPTPADYDGDGKADIAVFRSGTWYLNRSTAGFTGVQFGADSDKPVPNAFVP